MKKMKDDAGMTCPKKEDKIELNTSTHIKIPTHVARKSSTVQFQNKHYILFHWIY